MNRLKIIKELAEGPKGYWDILSSVDINGLEFIELMNSMFGKEIIPEKDKLKLSSEAKKRYMNLFRNGFKKEICTFKKITMLRPSLTEEFYQDFLDTKDIFRRIKFMHDICDVQEKKVLVLGDDDLFSLALGLTNLAKGITALDIDERVIDLINTMAKKYKLKVKAARYDISKALPSEYRHRFDVLVTEPVETIEGLGIWLSRCAELLKKDGVLYFGLTLVESPFSKWHRIQAMLNRMGFAITDIKRHHSTYPVSKESGRYGCRLVKKAKFEIKQKQKAWYNSWLIRCEAVKTPKPLVKGSRKLTKSFYYDKYFL
ncbi:bis-aminopropyl spermidine synthase family protein [Candidatus Woesearchaeota archaeon]|nr:bis-aminopropyl spermidine synthase family protein [Candidatus Woesearchaeota archaeon]